MCKTVRGVVVISLLVCCMVIVSSATSCNNLKADIVFVLDVSETTTARKTCTDGWWFTRMDCSTVTDKDFINYGNAKRFVNRFVEKIKDHINPRETRIGVVTFNSGASAYLTLAGNSFAFVTSHLAAISSTAPSSTSTGNGLLRARSMLNNYGRSNSTHVVVLLTDGKGKDSGSWAPNEAQSLKLQGKHLMTVAVIGLDASFSNSLSAYSDQMFFSPASIDAAFNYLVQLACQPLCAWDQDPCFPGSCGNHGLVKDCKCAPGFIRTGGVDKICQLNVKPDLTTCRVTLKDNSGQEVKSRSEGPQQHCYNQQYGFMNFQPTTLKADLNADLNHSVGPLPLYVSRARVGIVGFELRIFALSLTGNVRFVTERTVDQSSVCSGSASPTEPKTVLSCQPTITFSVSLSEGEKLCVDMKALGGGYYNLQDKSNVLQGTITLPLVSRTRRLCFTYDGTRPVHCSQVPGATGCRGSPLQLSTRLTRTRNIRVTVGSWVDQVPPGVPESSVSMITEYYLEVHGVHVSTRKIDVAEAATGKRKNFTGSSPFDVIMTLPEKEPALYAIILEVHDGAKNVAFARRLVLYDRSSRITVKVPSTLKVTTASPSTKYAWQNDFHKGVCLSWTDHFYNIAFYDVNYLLPVSSNSTRDIRGVYDQGTGVLPVRGTPSVHGIVKFETSWRQGTSTRMIWKVVSNVKAQSTCFPQLSLRDGSTYHLDVRATDIMNRSHTDGVILHADSSSPEVRELGLKRGRKSGGLYVHNSTDLSTMVLVINALDPHSGIKTLSWTLEEEGSVGTLGTRNFAIQRLDNRTSCGSESHCYCPSVGACEIYRYKINFNSLVHRETHTGEHHRNYNITLRATNCAGLITLTELKILIDASLPTVGVALEGQGDPGEVDFTRQSVLHVRWHGFRDEESGVEEYRVVAAGRCLLVQEVEEAENATTVTAGSLLRATFTLPAPGRYYTNVVAYNGAQTPSLVACSDGVVYDTSPPRLLNVSIAHAHTARALACTSAPREATWLMSPGFTKTRVWNTSKCAEICRYAGNVSNVDYLPTEGVESLNETESDELCRNLPVMTEDWWIVLPSDRLRVTWASEDQESAIEDFYVSAGSSRTSTADLIPMTSTHRQHVFHNSRSGLGHGTVFFLFLRAVNKPGSSTDLVIGPIVVDNTPPSVMTALTPTVDIHGHFRIDWEQGAIVDPEQPTGMNFEVMYRIGHSDGYITPFLRLSKSDIEDCQRENPRVVGCVRSSIDTLRTYNTGPGRAFFFQLHVQNAAGLIKTVNSSFFQLPPRQTHVVVLDITPTMAEDSEIAASGAINDVDVLIQPSSLCAAWTDLANQNNKTHSQVRFGAGRVEENDDIIPFSLVEANSGLACINISGLPFYEKLYSLISIPSATKPTVHSSDGFVVVANNDPRNTIEIFTGIGCNRNDFLHEELLAIQNTPRETNLSVQLTFHSGDVLFVELQPFVANVQFPGAYVIRTTLTGYQVILQSHVLALRLSGGAIASTIVRVYACLKDDLLWRKENSLTVSWELSGPAIRFTNAIEVEVLDQTCLQRSNSQELSCSVRKSHFRPSLREASFKDIALVTGHSYTTSVALCFDECLPRVFSAAFAVTTEGTVIKLDNAQIVSQTDRNVEVNVVASVELESPGQTCYFLWSLSRTSNGSRLLSDWQLREETQCDKIELTEQISFTGAPHGSLYACIQPVYPQRAAVPTCRQLTRSQQLEEYQIQSQPFHLIEMTQTQLQKINPEDYLVLQQADDQLHKLYDLDLDFTGSDVVVAALLTNSLGRAVTWFLMNAPDAPDTGDCVSDPSCVTWSSSSTSNASVVFPSYRAGLQSGEVYFVCAVLSPLQASKNSSDRHEVCGDGFVVDDHPPSAGTVTILNTNDGFLSDEQRVVVSWSGFQDALEDRAAAYSVASLSYAVALGSFPGGEDLASRVSVGKRTMWTFHHLQIAPGTDCYVTVTAHDMAGHVTSASSQPAIFDNTPPSHGKVTVQSYTGDNACVSSSTLHARWEAIADPESGIASQEISIGVHSEKHQNDVNTITPFAAVNGHSVMLNLSAELADGHSYVILLKSTNGAGLTTLTISEPLVADNSPPAVGAVWTNISGSSESDKASQMEYTTQWSGFTDSHCGLAYYRVGLGSNPLQDDVVSLHYVGLRFSYSWRFPLDSGKKYFALVEACNHAGLCSVTSSSGFLVDHTPPSSGHVTIGPNERHSPFWGHTKFLEARWHGFVDSQSGIREFSWCVGRSPGSCDVMSMTSAQRERIGTATGLSLYSAISLYVTVVAENNVGLRLSKTSSKFTVDISPPSVVSAPVFLSLTHGTQVTSQSDRSVVKLFWKFTDPGSSVVTQTLSINGHRYGRHGSQPLVVMATSDHMTLQLDQESLLSDGEQYTASVTACNAADLCTTAVSGTLLVDSSPPVVGQFEFEMSWRARVVHDSAGNSSYPVTEVNIVWTGFADEESGVRGYHLTAGRSYSSGELSGGVVFVPHTVSPTQTFRLNTRETLRSGDLLVLSLWAENTLGLISPVQRKTFEVFHSGGNAGTLLLQRHSCAPHYCSKECTCAPSIQKCQPNGNLTTCRELSSDSGFSNLDFAPRLGCPSCDLEFITSATCLEGHWIMPDLGSSLTVSRFQWSFSLSGTSPGVGLFDFESQPEWYDAGLRTSATYCLPHPRTLSAGSSYVLHVRSWLSRDSYVTQTSPPAVVDHSPPARRRGGSVIESDDATCGRDLDFFSDNNAQSLKACWAGVFSDQESGIQRYTVWIGTVPYGYDYQRQQDLHLSTSYNIDTSSMLEGTRYYVTVRATNGAGLTLTLTSDGVIKDVTPPVTGAVYTSSRHAVNHFTQDSTSLSASWHGFYDLTSGVTSYSAALYDTIDLSTAVVDFQETRLKRTHRFDSLGLEQGHRYKVAVKATNAAGLESLTAWSPAIMVDVTPPQGIACTNFNLAAEATLIFVPTASFQHEQYKADLTINVPADSHLLKVALEATSLRPGARAMVTLDEMTMPLVFDTAFLNRSSAQHVLMSPGEGPRRVSVVVYGNAGADISAQVYMCTESAASTSSVVTLRQVSPNALSICTTVVDEESSIKTLKIGVGSTPGGLQVKGWTLAGQSGHLVLTSLSHVQQAGPLYAVVLAQNHAGAWARFVSSQPVQFDTSPPVISGLNLTLTYYGDAVPQGSNVTVAVTAVAVWNAVDAESGGVTCTCTIVGQQTSDDMTQLTDDVTPGYCQWKLKDPEHGRSVQTIISCRNQVDVVSTQTSNEAVILTQPPDVGEVSLHSAYNYDRFSPYDRPDSTFRSGDSDLLFTLTGMHDPTVHQFEYRFLSDATPVTGWSTLPLYKTVAILPMSGGRIGNITAEVRALNRKGLVSDIVSTEVVLHDRRPSLTGVKATASLVNSTLLLEWDDVFSTDRDVTFTVFAGSRENAGDVINHYVTKSTTYTAPCNPSVQQLYLNILCLYRNGYFELYQDKITI